MSAPAPHFVVVGNVNQGKSSIVATLTEDPTVPIDAAPGTTVRAGEYLFKHGERTLFTLVDTPGFQDARHALAWMRERSTSPTDHTRVVADFVAAHGGDERFQDEVRLLRPILDGAGVLYVVDASGPPQPSNEAEMEVLRWTGQPRMALINRTRERDFVGEWRPWLEQYFNVVRSFNAQQAGFEDRVNLLRSFRELREDWRAPLDEAIGTLEADRRLRRHRAASTLAELLLKGLSHVERKRLEHEDPPPALKADLKAAFEKRERGFEEDARAEIERLYRHERVGRKEGALQIVETDLFSDSSWRLFGLTRGQLARYGVAWGAAIGAAIDLMVGGLSFFAGVAIGAAVGGAAGLFGGMRVARTWGERSRLFRMLFPGETGHYLCMGPPTNAAFAWMLLDRSLTHWRAIAMRAHARRDTIDLERSEGDGKLGVVAGLARATRDAFDEVFREILKRALQGSQPAWLRETLTHRLESLMKDLESAPPRAPGSSAA